MRDSLASASYGSPPPMGAEFMLCTSGNGCKVVHHAANRSTPGMRAVGGSAGAGKAAGRLTACSPLPIVRCSWATRLLLALTAPLSLCLRGGGEGLPAPLLWRSAAKSLRSDPEAFEGAAAPAGEALGAPPTSTARRRPCGWPAPAGGAATARPARLRRHDGCLAAAGDTAGSGGRRRAHAAGSGHRPLPVGHAAHAHYP